MKTEPYGVGGWLSLFCVVTLPLGVLYVAAGFGAISKGSHDGILGGSFLAALGVLTLLTFTFVCLHRRSAVNLVYTYLAAQFLFWLMAALGGESPLYFAVVFVISLTWALYFHRSQRVRNTFNSSAPGTPASQPASPYVPFSDVK